MKPFLNVYSQGEIVEIEKAIVLSERAWKADQENGMVCYISMKTFQDMKDWKSVKREKTADSAFSQIFNPSYLEVFMEI